MIRHLLMIGLVFWLLARKKGGVKGVCVWVGVKKSVRKREGLKGWSGTAY